MTSPSPQTTTGGPAAPVVVLVSASWAAPSRPAPTVLRELSTRWGSEILTLLVEDPEDEVLEQWNVDVLPTWLRFRPGVPQAPLHEGQEILSVPALSGLAPAGEQVVLEGPWTLTHRRTGALAKHEVDTEFGPHAAP